MEYEDIEVTLGDWDECGSNDVKHESSACSSGGCFDDDEAPQDGPVDTIQIVSNGIEFIVREHEKLGEKGSHHSVVEIDDMRQVEEETRAPTRNRRTTIAVATIIVVAIALIAIIIGGVLYSGGNGASKTTSVSSSGNQDEGCKSGETCEANPVGCGRCRNTEQPTGDEPETVQPEMTETSEEDLELDTSSYPSNEPTAIPSVLCMYDSDCPEEWSTCMSGGFCSEGDEAPDHTASSTSFVPVTFFAVGDVPYSEMEACLLPFELDKLNETGSFLIHLGDIKDGKDSDCGEHYFRDLAEIFLTSRVPTFFTLGDNGYLDCSDPAGAYTHWEDYLLSMHESPTANWPVFPTRVLRHENRSDLFSFLLQNVLFLGQSLPGVGASNISELEGRSAFLDENWRWTEAMFHQFAGAMDAVVIFGHSYEAVNDGYFVELKRIALDETYGRPPILFLEDEHFFTMEETFLGVDNMLRIATDDSVTPMSITVDPSATGLFNIFQYDRRCFCSTDHRPTRLVEWSSGPCWGQCVESHSHCRGMEACSPVGASC